MPNKSKKTEEEAKQLETVKAIEENKERLDTAEEPTPLSEELKKLSETPPTPSKDE